MIAVHVMALLAYGKGEAVTSEFMAGSVNTNPVVIRRILALLARAGLIETQEGAKGGARLAQPAKNIDLLAIYKAVESGELFALHPQSPNPACPVGCNIQAVLEPTLEAIEATMEATMAKTTVADVVRRLQTTNDS